MKIAIVVPGRFHAFDLGKALLRRGHDVTLFTNYPKWAVKRFGFPPERVRSFWIHGIISKCAYRLDTPIRLERWLNPPFGAWVAGELDKERWDVIHVWSGVSEEPSRTSQNRRSLNLLMRGSAHIRTQDAILKAEERRTSTRLDRPDQWIVAREEREYDLADRVIVLSSFAYDSFVAEGFDPAKLRLLPLGVDTDAFRPTPDVIEARCQRILSGEPLRILYVGTVCLRKGIWDLADIARHLKEKRFEFRLVGNVLPEVRHAVRDLRDFTVLVHRQPQHRLRGWYAASDLFLFPTLEEGFPAVLAQAGASGLPILTTPNGAGPHLVREGKTGWILPIRDPEAFIERLLWCDANRAVLAEMVQRIYDGLRARSWDDVARDFEAVCVDEISPVAYRAVANG